MKYILRNYISDYKTCLTTNNFNINTYISFTVVNTRSRGVKLRHNVSSTSKECHFYFNRISRLWNSLPIIDLNLPINLIKSKIKFYFWQHFIANFDPDNMQELATLSLSLWFLYKSSFYKQLSPLVTLVLHIYTIKL